MEDLRESLGYKDNTNTSSKPPTEVTTVTSSSDEVSEHSEITNNNNPVDGADDIHAQIVKLKASLSKLSMSEADKETPGCTGSMKSGG